jgi:hypothetical protein
VVKYTVRFDTQPCVLPTECIYVFCVIPTLNNYSIYKMVFLIEGHSLRYELILYSIQGTFIVRDEAAPFTVLVHRGVAAEEGGAEWCGRPGQQIWRQNKYFK